MSVPNTPLINRGASSKLNSFANSTVSLPDAFREGLSINLDLPKGDLHIFWSTITSSFTDLSSAQLAIMASSSPAFPIVPQYQLTEENRCSLPEVAAPLQAAGENIPHRALDAVDFIEYLQCRALSAPPYIPWKTSLAVTTSAFRAIVVVPGTHTTSFFRNHVFLLQYSHDVEIDCCSIEFE